MIFPVDKCRQPVSHNVLKSAAFSQLLCNDAANSVMEVFLKFVMSGSYSSAVLAATNGLPVCLGRVLLISNAWLSAGG